MSKFGNLISQAKSQSSNKVSDATGENTSEAKPENQLVNKSGKPENQMKDEKFVNLSIKVPEYLRRHWVSEAKRTGTSITAEVTIALNEKFGNGS